MSLIVAKKFAVLSALAIGGGYTGAVVYGSDDEVARGLLEQHIPGFDKSIEVYQSLRLLGKNAWAGISERMQELRSQKVAASKNIDRISREYEALIANTQASGDNNGSVAHLKDLQTKYATELENLREQLQREKEEGIAKELARKEAAEREVAMIRAEQKAKFNQELEEIMENERQLRVASLKELSERIDDLEIRTETLLEKLAETLKAESFSAIIDRMTLIASGASGAKNVILAKSLEYLMQNSQEELVRNVCHSLVSLTKLNPPRCADRQSLVSEFFRVKSLAEKYADFGGAHWIYVFPLIRDVAIKFRAFAAEDANREMAMGQIQTVATLVRQGDVEGALRVANQITGWSRIVLKDWMEDCRRLLEIEQGLAVLKSYHLALRIR